MTTQRNELTKALAQLISNADAGDRGDLSEALEAYAYAFPRSYRDLEKKGGLVANLLAALEESSDARIYRNSSNLPDARELLK
jgi:hypothetical protein